MTWYTGTWYNGYGLAIWVNFIIKCVCVRFGSNGFMTKMQRFPMDGHYRMNIISGVRHLRPDSVVPLMLCTVAVQWLGHQHYTIGPSG